MRWTATISCYEQPHHASPVGIDAFCRKSHCSRLEHYTPWRAGAQHTSQSLCANSTCASVGATGLEPATPGPQTSTYLAPTNHVREIVVSWEIGWNSDYQARAGSSFGANSPGSIPICCAQLAVSQYVRCSQ